MGDLAEAVELRRSGRAEAALDVVRSDRGRRTMDAIRAAVDAVRADARASAAAARGGAARRWTAVLGFAAAARRPARRRRASRRPAPGRAVAAGFARVERFARALGSVPGMLRDPGGRITHWTRGAERLYGFRAEEALGRNSHELLRTRFPQPLPEIEAALRRDGEWQGELAHRRRDGAEVVVAEHMALHRGGPDEPEAVVEVGANVTALRRAEEALRQREGRAPPRPRRSNDRHLVLGGGRGRADAGMGRALQGAVRPACPTPPWTTGPGPAPSRRKDRAEAEAAIARALDPADPRDEYACEYRALRRDGRALLVAAAGRAFFEPDPAAPAGRRAARILGTMSDVTEPRRAEQERRHAGALLRAIGEATPDLLYAKDRESRMLYANPALLEVVGKTAEEVLGRSDAEWHDDPAEAAAILAVDRRVMGDGDGRPEVAEEPFTTPGGPTRVFLSTKAPLRDAAGAVVGVVGVSRDITARKRAEQHRELLVGELNHRVKNTLAIVQSIAAQTLGGGGRDGEARREAFEDRLVALAHAHDLLTREHWGGVQLRDLAGHALAPFGLSDGAGARVRVAGPPARVGPKQAIALAMAMHELATNAAKYGALSNASGRVDLTWEPEGGAHRPGVARNRRPAGPAAGAQGLRVPPGRTRPRRRAGRARRAPVRARRGGLRDASAGAGRRRRARI
jgi:PAS domain S-box-containing protein